MIFVKKFVDLNNRSDLLIGSNYKDEFEVRSNEILDLLDKYKNPRKEQKLSEYFEQYKICFKY